MYINMAISQHIPLDIFCVCCWAQPAGGLNLMSKLAYFLARFRGEGEPLDEY